MFRLFLTPALAGLVGLSLAPAPSDSKPSVTDWQQFRGPNRDGISPDKGLLTEWPEGGPTLVWKAEGLGTAFSSVSLSGTRVFTMGDKGESSFVIALERGTGKQLWSTAVGKPGGNYKGTRCTPTIDGDRVYAIGQFGDLVCLEVETGKEVWRKNFVTDFGVVARKAPGWNFTESPLIDGKKLVCTPGSDDATLFALDKMTGDVIWKSSSGGRAGYASMVISEAAGRRQYVQLTAGGVVSVDAETGKLLWSYNKMAGNTANVPNPIVLGDQIFSAAGYDGGGGALLSITRQGDGLQAREEYFEGNLRNKHGGVVRVGDYVYGDRNDSSQLWCAEWKTGKVVWSAKERKKGSGSISLVYADGCLYCRYSNGIVALVEASPKGYVEKGTLKIPNSDRNSWNHPVVIGGKLYLREKDVLWCYDVKAQ